MQRMFKSVTSKKNANISKKKSESRDHYIDEHLIPKEVHNENELVNINCYEYLLEITQAIPSDLIKKALELPNEFKHLKSVLYYCASNSTYNPQIGYGNLYKMFRLELEKNIEIRKRKKNEDDENTLEELLRIILQKIYENENHILQRSVNLAKQAIENSPRSRRTKALNQKLESNVTPALNVMRPTEMGSASQTAKKYLGYNVSAPENSLPSYRSYNYKQPNDPKECRFPTPVRIVKFHTKISPSFAAWVVDTKKPKSDDIVKKRFTHVYINNLPTQPTRKAKIFRSRLESNFTKHLHAIEDENPHFAVITLPSSKGFLSSKNLEKNTPLAAEELHQKLETMLKILVDKETGEKNDFKMSDAVRETLFGESFNTKHSDKFEQITKLLQKSFKELLGIDVIFKIEFDKNGDLKKIDIMKHKNQTINVSEAELQAAYFHFIKFELTNYILEKLNPDSFNITCFDAIDRGAAASLYYNLIKSIERNQPLSKEEFDCGLHAAAIMTKGRLMNHQSKTLWNAIDAYLDQNSVKLMADKRFDWLFEWRDQYVPKESPKYKKPLYQLYRYYDEIKFRQSDQKNFLGFESFLGAKPTGIPRSFKEAAALKILNAIKCEEEPILDENDKAALREGDLAKIYAALRQEHCILLDVDIKQHRPRRNIMPSIDGDN